MSWKDMMRRVLPPIDGVTPDITSRYGEAEGRSENSTKPHRGVDFNYWGVAKLNRSNPAMRAPVTGIVTRADKGGFGTIAIRDADGFSHEILHSRAQHVTVGDPVVAGQLIGTMGNTGLKVKDPKDANHAHYQLKDPSGKVIDPSAYWDHRESFDPNPAPPTFLSTSDTYASWRQILRQARTSLQFSAPRLFRASSERGAALPRPSAPPGNSCLALPRLLSRSTKRDHLSSRRKTSPRAMLEKKFGAWSGFLPASQTSPDTIRTLQPRYLT